MKNQNMTYALKDGKTVHISEVENGLRCECICPACGERLIARKGTKVIHHFAHKSTVECEYGYQTSLHLVAKDIISKYRQICIPALFLNIPKSGKRILIEDAQVIQVSEVILEKKISDIIPDILLMTNVGILILEIYVTHEVDDEKKKKIKRLNIPTLEIDLSKLNRNITKEELAEVLIKETENKKWIYNGKREQTYTRFVEVSESKKIVSRGYALHVDECPIKSRVWKGKPYANFTDDCNMCEYFIDYKKSENHTTDNGEILCSGKLRIGKIKDFDTSLEERMREYDKKREEEKYELISQGICPQCGCYLKIRHGRYGEFFGCSNYPHCQFTFSYDEE